jgi:hypothetical protein
MGTGYSEKIVTAECIALTLLNPSLVAKIYKLNLHLKQMITNTSESFFYRFQQAGGIGNWRRLLPNSTFRYRDLHSEH